MTQNEMSPSRWGEPTAANVTLVRLRWRSVQVTHGFDLKTLAGKLLRSGVYVYEGCHDAHPARTILYIGEAGAGSSSGTLASRLPSSLSQLGRMGSEGAWCPWAECWDLVLRWSYVERKSVREVERLLIRAHCPVYNKQLVRGANGGNLVVINAEDKGRLMPVVASHYFHSTGWPAQADGPVV